MIHPLQTQAALDDRGATPPDASVRSRSVASRLREVFSLRRNLRRLFVPSADQLRPLDGLRAISILWLMAFHAGWYIGLHVPVQTYASLVFARWMLPIWRGDFGVDIFFVLSGFLIAGGLEDERTANGGVRLGRFYLRRLTRLWPSLLVVIVFNTLFMPDHNVTALASLACVSNFVPVTHASMGWTWSLSIEEQFYLFCPFIVLALGARRLSTRMTVLAALAAVLAAIGAWVVHRGGFHAWDSEVVVNRDFRIWAHAYDVLYDKPWMRAGPLVVGVGSAYLYRSRAAMQALSSHPWKAVLALIVALGVAVASTHWPLVAFAPRHWEIVYLALYRIVFGLAVGYTLLFSLSGAPVGRSIGSILSMRVLHPIAQLAYSAYLINPIVTTLVDHALAPFVWRRQLPAFAVFLPFDLLATLGAAAVLYLFVERPFMNLRNTFASTAVEPRRTTH